MGLDISHYRATLDKTANFVTAEGGRNRYVPFEWFAAYTQNIEHDKLSEHVILISNGLRKHLRRFGTRGYGGKRSYAAEIMPHQHLKPYGQTRYVTLAEGDDLEARMAAFERDYLAELAKANSRVVKLSEKIVEVPNRGRYGILSFGKHLLVRGYYYESVGYQRKGVLPDFWGRFEASGALCRLADAEAMLAMIHPDCYQHFKAHFVDNFIEGASLISWAG